MAELFPFGTWKMCQVFLDSMVLDEKSTVILIGICFPINIEWFLSGCFKIFFPLSLVFTGLIMMCLGTYFFKFILFWIHSSFWICRFIRSDQLLSHVRLFATPWIAARQASLSITNARSSLRLTSIESVMPSSHLILCRPLLLLPPIPPRISLFQWVNSSHEVAKVLEFQL